MYILAFPLLLIIPFLLLFPDSKVLFIISIVVGSMLSIYALATIIFRQNFLRFTNIMAISFLLGYSLSTLIYFVTHFSFVILSEKFDVTGYYVTQKELSLAISMVYFVCATLFLFSRVDYSIDSVLHKTNLVFLDIRATLLVYLGLGIVFFALISNNLGYQGVQKIDEASNQISIIGAISIQIAPVLPAMFLIKIKQKVNKHLIFIDIIGFALSLILLFSLTRRTLLYSIIISLIALAPKAQEIHKINPRILLQYLIFGFFLLIIIYIGFYFFMGLRIAQQTIGESNKSIFELLLTAKDSGLLIGTELGDTLHENMSNRPFFLVNYLGILISAHQSYSPLWGEELSFAIKSAIPSTIWPSKIMILPSMSEELTHPLLGLPIYDGSNTIITFGLNDFGVFGAILYPVFIAHLYGSLVYFLQERVPTFIFYFIILNLIFKVFSLEESLAVFLTVGLRDIFITSLGLLVIWRFLGGFLWKQAIGSHQDN
ncbi:MAG: hypothetical protein P9F75_01750 [Candidatus Contendobacter sp.]|nr:hypothetical protein [Candidatus Contendobacter sp.]